MEARSEDVEETIDSVSLPAGRLRWFYGAWKKITEDTIILQWVLGYNIPFVSPPRQSGVPTEAHWSSDELNQIPNILNQLSHKGVIRKCEPTTGQFVSGIFVIQKPDGFSRLILNLKKLNKFIKTEHFKLEDLRSARDLMVQGCFMSTLDLKDAYYLISIAEASRKFLRFNFQGTLFEFNCLPFGLNVAPYVFTKLMKPAISCLRKRGIRSIIYLDDILLLGDSYEQCKLWSEETCSELKRLGFLINAKKSQLNPSRCCKFL